MNIKFLRFLNDRYKGISQIRNAFPDEYNRIIEFNKDFNNIHWGQKLYNYVNNLSELPKCVCGHHIKFYKFNMGYAIYCSNKCRYGDGNLKEKIKQSYIKKYGVENPLQSSEIQEKRKNLFFKKYGVEHQSQLTNVKEKRKQTCLNKFGRTTNLLCDDTKIKIKQSNLKKFGVEHNSQSEIIKEKKKQTNLRNLGVEYNLQSKEFKEKSKATNLKKYGVAYSSQSKDIRQKQIETRHNKYIIQISELLNVDVKNISINDDVITIRKYCSIHNEFTISANNLHQRWFKYNKKICTKCYPPIKQISACEIEIKTFIDSLNLEYSNNNKNILKNNFEIDIYLPNSKLGIEFDGIYWHSDIYKNNNYHLNKTEECEKQGIQLLHVFEDEWANKKEIVKSIIKSKLGIINDRIYGRKCVIGEINNVICRNFLIDNHIQDSINSKIKLGLFYENELVSVMTFGKKRIAMGNKINIEGEYEMLRFCNKLNTSVIGGASKLLKYFIKTHSPKSILSFADRRYSQGNLYKKLGFNFIGNTKPNYWYFQKNGLIRYHRFKFRKDVLIKEGFDKSKTEHEIMSERNYFCIYDCGNMKFELKF